MTRVVVDAGPVIALVRIGRLDLLRDLFATVTAPADVAREARPSLPDPPPWFRVVHPPSVLPDDLAASGLGPGEAAAIHLARLVSADWLVVDDLQARRWALRHEMPIVGTAGILVMAHRRRLVPAVRPVLDDLIRTGTFIGPRLYDDILRSVDEPNDR